jgi:predicted RNA-binding Zn-ribbon protein involved in translation (DUF1610 family)
MDPWTDDPWTGGESGVPEWAIDDPDLDDESAFRRTWPTSLDAAMRCLSCGAEVAWRPHRDAHTGRFVCPVCGAKRPSRNAGKRLRHKVGERDKWTCHRCGLPIDSTLTWPHPLSPVADHYPISRGDGGPAILENLKIAHSLCNGNTASARNTSRRDYPSDQRRLLEMIVRLPFDDKGHVQVGD